MTTIKLRRGTKAEWDAADPVLALAEPGLITDTGEIRTGDGATAFNALPESHRFLSNDILSGTYHKADEPAAKLELTTDETIATGTTTKPPWDGLAWDNTGGAMWDSANPTRLVLPEAGLYLIMAGVVWAFNNTGERLLDVQVNGASNLIRVGSRHIGEANSESSVATIYKAASGDYAQMRVNQNSGGDLDLLADDRTFLLAQKVGEA